MPSLVQFLVIFSYCRKPTSVEYQRDSNAGYFTAGSSNIKDILTVVLFLAIFSYCRSTTSVFNQRNYNIHIYQRYSNAAGEIEPD